MTIKFQSINNWYERLKFIAAKRHKQSNGILIKRKKIVKKVETNEKLILYFSKQKNVTNYTSVDQCNC